jgi:hypothetical protein
MMHEDLLKQNKQLFNIDHTNEFYHENDDLPRHVRFSWYMFAYRFLPCVNSDWLKCISGSQAKHCINMFKYITVSDEAFVRWVIECKKDKLEAEFNDPSKKYIDRKFEKPKGSHDSNKYLVRYNEIYEQVKRLRNDRNRSIYNNWFWTYFKKSNQQYFQEAPVKSRDVSINLTKILPPTLDEAVKFTAPTTTYAVEEDDFELTSEVVAL